MEVFDGKVRMRKGFGSVRFLGEGRRLAYAVHPPARRAIVDGDVRYIRPKAICYVPDWFTGFAVLTAWHAGIYRPGMEEEIYTDVRSFTNETFSEDLPQTQKAWESYCRRIQELCLKKESRQREKQTQEYQNPEQNKNEERSATVKEIFVRYYASKFGKTAPKKLADTTADNARSIFRKLKPIHDKEMDSLTIDDLQALVCSIHLGRTMVSKTVTMLKALYKYALPRGLCTKDPARYLITPDTADYVHHQDFTDGELQILWKNKDDLLVQMILIMCYSGFRISAYKTLQTNTQERYFKGGIKTSAGKDRIVPIHSAIMPFVEMLDGTRTPYLCGLSSSSFSRRMHSKLVQLGIDTGSRHHTPHSCRHTFSRLCESYGVREADRKRMLGHSFGSDITNGIYGHRTLEELRGEIEKIRLP